MSRYTLAAGRLISGGETVIAVASPGRWMLTDAAPHIELEELSLQFYRHGWTSWSPTGWVGLDEPPFAIEGTPEECSELQFDPAVHAGSNVGAVRLAGGGCVLLGELGYGPTMVGADRKSIHGATQDPDAQWLLTVGSEREVFDAYARLLAERQGVRELRADRIWSSWYSHYEAVSEKDVVGQLDGLRDAGFHTVQIDDGWEKSVGDWQANDRFPRGMTAVASEIREHGMAAGLWLAPFIARGDSELFNSRPELFARGAGGSPLVAGTNWGGPYYALDVTLPQTRAHLRQVFERIVSWGYSFLKLDFVFAAAVAAGRHTDVSGEQAYRDAITDVRSWVGDDVYLLGCGAPLMSSMGILDGIRVGPDTAAYWRNVAIPHLHTASTANALQSSSQRGWLMHTLQLDPDVVYFRRRRSLLDEPQRQAGADLAAIYGFRGVSDPIGWLAPGELAQLREWLHGGTGGEWLGDGLFRIDGKLVDIAGLLRDEPPIWTIAE